MPADKSRPRHTGLILLLVLAAPFFAWHMARPSVVFYFSENGQGRLRYILNIQDNISKNEIYPGQATSGFGHIFPDDDFFMQFDWNNAGKHHCVSVRPKWPVTNIYIGADGAVDKRSGSGTDTDRLVPCFGENQPRESNR